VTLPAEHKRYLDLPLLSWATKSSDFKSAQGNVFRFSPGSSLSPPPKRAWFEGGSHQLNHFPWRQIELTADRIKAGSVFPCHFNHAVKLFSGQVATLHCE